MNSNKVFEKVRLDKIASSTVNIPLEKEVQVAEEVHARRGNVVVVKALEEKRVYDRLELASGRMAKVSRGDVIAGVLGERRAIQGFAGKIPSHINRGDVLNILNLGGVIGQAVSYNREYGQPLQAEVLGAVLRDGAPVNIADNAKKLAHRIHTNTPLVVVSGTSMNSGKTEVASNIIQQLCWKGYRIGACKVSGISALKDVLNMLDHGAVAALSFLDYGFPSTVASNEVPLIAKGAVNDLSVHHPQLIIVELGDGVLGDYGVMNFFNDSEIRQAITCNIVCAIDPVGAWGMKQIMEENRLPIHLVSGPVTDNIVGEDFVHNRLGLEGINAYYQKEQLGKFVLKLVF
ncbi:MAG: hypothetical protein ACOC7U_10055 [Spirochaetota bacterium]